MKPKILDEENEALEEGDMKILKKNRSSSINIGGILGSKKKAIEKPKEVEKHDEKNPEENNRIRSPSIKKVLLPGSPEPEIREAKVKASPSKTSSDEKKESSRIRAKTTSVVDDKRKSLLKVSSREDRLENSSSGESAKSLSRNSSGESKKGFLAFFRISKSKDTVKDNDSQFSSQVASSEPKSSSSSHTQKPIVANDSNIELPSISPNSSSSSIHTADIKETPAGVNFGSKKSQNKKSSKNSSSNVNQKQFRESLLYDEN
jgi:hypothetical protein